MSGVIAGICPRYSGCHEPKSVLAWLRREAGGRDNDYRRVLGAEVDLLHKAMATGWGGVIMQQRDDALRTIAHWEGTVL